jgi:hypothetical protein
VAERGSKLDTGYAFGVQSFLATMLIIETSAFTRRVQALLRDEEYRLLQARLAAQPDAGAVIKGSGGLRKLRWSVGAQGKRGGVRVIYYWSKPRYRVLMLLIYSKSERDDLTADQLKVLRRLVEAEYR